MFTSMIIKTKPSIPLTILLTKTPFSTLSSSSSSSSSSRQDSDNNNLRRLDQKDWLSPNEVFNILNPIQNPQTVIHAFNKLSTRKDYKPTSSLYVLLITSLAKSGNFDAIDDILVEIKLEKKCRLTDEFFYDVIKIYGHVGGRINKAIETLFDMRSYNVWPSLKTFNFVLNLLVNTKQFDVVDRVYMGASKLGVEVDACCLNILMKGLCQCGDVEGAVQLLDEFPKQRCEPNEKTFSTLMHGLCKKGRIDEAFELFGKMESEGIEPDTIMFNILISGLRRNKRIGEVMELLERMKLKGCDPNAGSYHGVLYGLLDVHKYSDAKHLMCKMISKGMCPSFVSYKLIINGFCKQMLVEEACWALKRMVDQGFVPKMGIWRQILHSMFSDNGRKANCLDLFESLIQSQQS